MFVTWRAILLLYSIPVTLTLNRKRPVLSPFGLQSYNAAQMEQDGDVWVHGRFFVGGNIRYMQRKSVEFLSYFDQAIRTLYYHPVAPNILMYFDTVLDGLTYLEHRYRGTTYLLEQWTAALRLGFKATRTPQITMLLLLSVYDDELTELEVMTRTGRTFARIPPSMQDRKLHLLYHTLMLVDRILPTLGLADPALNRFKDIQGKLARVIRRWRAIRSIRNRVKYSLTDRMAIEASPTEYATAWETGNLTDAMYSSPKLFDHPTELVGLGAQMFEHGESTAIKLLGFTSFKRPDNLPDPIEFDYKGRAIVNIGIARVKRPGANMAEITDLKMGDFKVTAGGNEVLSRFEAYRQHITNHLKLEMKKIQEYHGKSKKKKQKIIFERLMTLKAFDASLSISLECDWLPSLSTLVPGLREFMHIDIIEIPYRTKFELWRGRGTPAKRDLIRAYAKNYPVERRNALAKKLDSTPDADQLLRLGDIEQFGMCLVENAFVAAELTNTQATCIQFPYYFDPTFPPHAIYPACLGVYPAGTRLVIQQESLVQLNATKEKSAIHSDKKPNIGESKIVRPKMTENLLDVDKDSTMKTKSNHSAPFINVAKAHIREANLPLGFGTQSPKEKAEQTQTTEFPDIAASLIEQPETDTLQNYIKASPTVFSDSRTDKSFSFMQYPISVQHESNPHILRRSLARRPPEAQPIRLPVFNHQAALEGLFRYNLEEAAAQKIDHLYQLVLTDVKYDEGPPVAYQKSINILTCHPGKTWYEDGFSKSQRGTPESLTNCRAVPNGAPVPENIRTLLKR